MSAHIETINGEDRWIVDNPKWDGTGDWEFGVLSVRVKDGTVDEVRSYDTGRVPVYGPDVDTEDIKDQISDHL